MIGTGITLEKEKQFGKFFSLIPYTNVVKGLTLTGFKYPLDHYDFKGFCSLGVSNEIIAERAEITFEDGIFIVISNQAILSHSPRSQSKMIKIDFKV